MILSKPVNNQPRYSNRSFYSSPISSFHKSGWALIKVVINSIHLELKRGEKKVIGLWTGVNNSLKVQKGRGQEMVMGWHEARVADPGGPQFSAII